MWGEGDANNHPHLRGALLTRCPVVTRAPRVVANIFAKSYSHQLIHNLTHVGPGGTT